MARRRRRSKKVDWNKSLPFLIVFGLVAIVAFGYFAPTGKFTGIAQEKVWVVGNDGLILKSLDGGETWTEQDSGTTSNLQTVFF